MSDRVILVVGDVADDIVVRPLASVAAASDTPARIRRLGGGSAANTAAWLGDIGAAVRFVGRVGRDDVDRHRALLRRHRVDARLAADRGLPTATIVITVDSEGERSMYVDRGANAGLNIGDIPAGVWQDVSWLHLSGYSFFDPLVRPVVQELAAYASAQQVPWSVDPCSAAYLQRAGGEAFRSWTRGAQVAFPNTEEAAVLTGESEPAVQAAILTRTYDNAVVTCGTDGVVAATKAGESATVRAERIRAADSTGAGDAFIAGFLAARQSGATLVNALEAGTRTAARSVSRMGGRP